MLLTSIGTVLGALFSNYVLFPGMMKFFATMSGPRLRMMPSINDTFDHYIRMMVAMIAVFQMPTLVFFLAKFRLVTARFLWRHFKYRNTRQLHRRCGAHDVAGSVEPNGIRAPDDRPVPDQHRHRVDRRAEGRVRESCGWIQETRAGHRRGGV